MNIGIDIDGCLMDDDTYRLDTMSKYCFENNLNDIDYPYNYERKCNFPSVEVKEDYRSQYYFEYVKNAPARVYAKEVIKLLRDRGHKIIIITGRYKTTEDSKMGKQMRNDTVNWLNKNEIYFDEICYAKMPKTKEVQENNIDIMIDDSPEIIGELVKYTKVLCFDNRYNRDINYVNMTRVFSWYDIYSKISKGNF